MDTPDRIFIRDNENGRVLVARDNAADAEYDEIVYCAMCAEPTPTPLILDQYFFCFKCHCWQLLPREEAA